MGIIKFDPFRGFEQITRKMSDFMSDFEKGVSFEYGAFLPKVDIAEDEKNLFIHVEIPGIAKEDIKLTISDDNVLVIKGEKKRNDKYEIKEDEKTFIRAERTFGAFTRSFMLPDNINKDSINAKYENGVLIVTLEKKEPEKPKEVQVEIN